MKKILLIVAIFIVLAISFFAVQHLVSFTSEVPYKKNQLMDANSTFIKGVNDCGPQTLQVICELLGVKSTIEELARLAGTDETGTTMGGLYQAAKKKRLDPLAGEFTVQKLQEWNRPAIAFVKNNHFVVVESVVAGKLRILDPPRLPYQMTLREFTDVWEGHALMFGSDQKVGSLHSEPSIVFDKAYYHFGKVPQNYQISETFMFRNRGLKPLEVSIESSSCQCTAALMSERVVPPGQTGTVKITYIPKDWTSEQVVKETVMLRTNDPRKPRVVLTMTGQIYPTVKVIPSALNFRKLAIGSVAEKTLTVINPNVRVLGVEANSPDIIARIIELSGAAENQTQISVSIKPSTGLQKSDDKLFIYTDDVNSPKIEIPIMYEIAAPVVVSPRRVFFGVMEPAADNVRNVNISKGNIAGELKIQHIENTSPFISLKLTDAKIKDNYDLQISINREAPAGAIRDTITVHTNQIKISIPVYGVVMK